MKNLVEKFQTKNLFFVFAMVAGLAMSLSSTAFACPSGDDEGDEEFLSQVQSLGSCDCDCGDDSEDDEEGFSQITKFVDSSDCGSDDEEDEE